jgi:F420H(2)-dependent quinone reductase
MPLSGEYEPSPTEWVRNQVERYESTSGREANTLMKTGMPVIILTTVGSRSGKLRKTPLMRVEHDGEYALVGSLGGAPKNPEWVHNVRADPKAATVQDGPQPFDVEIREIEGDEKSTWWERAVAAYPPYADYQAKTDRVIPVFLATRTSG